MASLAGWWRGLSRPKTGRDALELLAAALALGLLLVGVAAFVAAWAVLGAAAEGVWPAWRPQLRLLVVLALVGVALLAALLVLSRVASPRVLGPVAFYDFLRATRRARYYLVRTLYAFTLLGLLSWVYFVWTASYGATTTVSASEAASFANSFFSVFMSVQFLVLTLVTPAYVAGAVAEEKERKTLEFLLATDLRNREIVLGKLASRLLNLTLLLLTGLPILSFLQFLGGVDPMLVLAGFGATLLTVASLAGLSVYNSTLSRRARDAIVLTYLMMAAYLVLSGLSWLLLVPRGWEDFPSEVWPNPPCTLRDVVTWANAGNVFAAITLMQSRAATSGVSVHDAVLSVLRNYALFHGVVALGGPLWAVWRLRAVALREASRPARRSGAAGEEVGGGRRVGALPVVWKEVVAEGGPRLNLAGRVVLALLVPVSFAPAVVILAWKLDQELMMMALLLVAVLAVPVVLFLIAFLGRRRRGSLGPALLLGGALLVALAVRLLQDSLGLWESRRNDMLEAMNIVQVRIAGTAVACLLLLAVAVRAAGSVSTERDKQTLDGLLTTPLDSDTILFGKWLGAVLSVRRGWLWLGGIWGLGVVTGSLHPLALPPLVVTWLVYASVLAGLGLWFSVTAGTTLRATTWTLLSAVGAGLGHWLLMLCCATAFLFGPAQAPEVMTWLVQFLVGLTPPAVLGYSLPFSSEQMVHNTTHPEDLWQTVAFAVLGTAVWAALAAALWLGTSGRFREMASRVPMLRRTMQ